MKLKYDKLLSNVAFNFNLRRYNPPGCCNPNFKPFGFESTQCCHPTSLLMVEGGRCM